MTKALRAAGLLLLTLQSGCARADADMSAVVAVERTVAVQVEGAQPVPGTGAATASTAAIAAAAREIREAAGDRSIIVIGEMHGTREVPALAARLATDLLADGVPVRVALELPRDQQAAIDGWIAGGDREAAKAAMRAADPGWSLRADRSDGRRNVEVFALYDALRALEAAGHDIGALAFDVPRHASSDDGAAARDARMAGALRDAQAALPGARWIVVTGNVHAMTFVPAFCPQCQASMTTHLVDLEPFSIDVSAASGAFLACIDARPCGPTPIADPGRSGPVSDAGIPFDYRIVLPRFTPAGLPSL